jgi:hypothetical protein
MTPCLLCFDLLPVFCLGDPLPVHPIRRGNLPRMTLALSLGDKDIMLITGLESLHHYGGAVPWAPKGWPPGSPLLWLRDMLAKESADAPQ